MASGPLIEGPYARDGPKRRSYLFYRLFTLYLLPTMSSKPIHPNKQNFIEGLDLILQRWVALKMAIEMEWGGHDSAEKAEHFRADLVEYFDKEGKSVEPEDIEDILLQVMSTEFSTMLEDQSEVLVSKQIWTLFHDCVRGKTEFLENLRHLSSKPLNINVSKANSETEEDSNSEGESDGSDMEE